MKVAFHKTEEGRLCSWRAEPPKRRPFQGATMGSRAGHTELPHDLATFVVEAALGLEHGFWNLVANGATFRSLGRRRTEPGRRLILAYRKELDEAEWAVNAHAGAWQRGEPTPVGPALDEMLARWRALPLGEELVVEWPTRRLPGVPARAADGPLVRRRPPRARR